MASSFQTSDDIIIGSSPMMLMQAIHLAENGHDVTVIDRNPRWGGSWQTAVLDNGEEVEIACHLIEVFPGVYDLLAAYSGVVFTDLDAQPIRISKSGAIVPYFNRLLMLASGARLLLGWSKARAAALIGRRPDRNVILNFDTKLKSFVRHQLPSLFQRTIMQAPRDGFVDFMDGLINRAKGHGVTFVISDVTGLTRGDDGLWYLNASVPEHHCAKRIHLTTSTNLRKTGKGSFAASPPTYATRVAMVVDVSREDVNRMQSYVAFWQDPHIARISRIDMPDATQRPVRFLVEFHKTLPDGWTHILTDRMHKARILKAGGSHRIVGQVDCTHTTNINQLPAGQIDDGVWGYYSYGNLAAGIAAWNKGKRTK